jgi:hypothetical protein
MSAAAAAVTSMTLAMQAEGSEARDAAADLAAQHDTTREDDGAIAMHLSKLPFRLALLTFHAKHLPECAFAIMQALLQPSDCSESHCASSKQMRPSFFSLTQAGLQVSIIVESSCAALFPAHLVTRHRSTWYALQVSQGTESMDAAGLVAPLSSLLASANCSIYFLSTSNNDFVLVDEKEVQLALDTITASMRVMVDE